MPQSRIYHTLPFIDTLPIVFPSSSVNSCPGKSPSKDIDMPRLSGNITVDGNSFHFIALIPVSHAVIHIIGQFSPSAAEEIPRTRAMFTYDNLNIAGPDRPIITRNNTSYIERTNLHIEMESRVPGGMNLTLEAEVNNSRHIDLTSGSVEIYFT